VAGSELFLGLACFVPRFRKTAALVATAFHLATLAVLAFRLRWDPPVWPWMLALAAAWPGLLVPWRGPGLGVDFALARRPARGVAVTRRKIRWDDLVDSAAVDPAPATQ